MLMTYVEQIANQLLIRRGEPITDELAYERARNIVAALHEKLEAAIERELG